ncbi:hypothetical protein Rhal01_03835 [Rubritalea halochordaticola]|uniref:DUF420 domain-containing protein n=1 Tax=Rubritalea halochordaticola TaxID=714537 RepID=A0ABP9V4P0_9BACT
MDSFMIPLFPAFSCLAAFLVGLMLGGLIAWLVTRPAPRRAVRWTTGVLCALGWLTYLGGLLYWRHGVAPSLDGSEGAGVGFGYILIHHYLLALALFLSGITTGVFSRKN